MFLKYTVWLLPIIIVIAAFFTSAIRRFRFGRYALFIAVLFLAFIFDLQSLSFRSDRIDFALEMAVLLALADLFWRGVRSKNKVLRIGALLVGLLFFVLSFKDWALAGTASVDTLKLSAHLSTYKAHKRIFFVKEQWEFDMKKAHSPNITLYRTLKISPLEQQIDRFEVPEGYENSQFTYAWRTSPQSVSVQIISEPDTLWTLGDPLPQH
jgi:hypothetical protein